MLTGFSEGVISLLLDVKEDSLVLDCQEEASYSYLVVFRRSLSNSG